MSQLPCSGQGAEAMTRETAARTARCDAKTCRAYVHCELAIALMAMQRAQQAGSRIFVSKSGKQRSDGLAAVSCRDASNLAIWMLCGNPLLNVEGVTHRLGKFWVMVVLCGGSSRVECRRSFTTSRAKPSMSFWSFSS